MTVRQALSKNLKLLISNETLKKTLVLLNSVEGTGLQNQSCILGCPWILFLLWKVLISYQ